MFIVAKLVFADARSKERQDKHQNLCQNAIDLDFPS
jgi:hypothetical protein